MDYTTRFTYPQLVAKGLDAITVKSTVINPDDWYYTKQEDGLYWPYEKRELFIIVDISNVDVKKSICTFSHSSEAEKGKACFYHTKDRAIENYSIHDYVMEHGHELVEIWNPDKNRTEFSTVLKLLKNSVLGLRHYRHGEIKMSTAGEGGFVYYADFDKARASEWMPNEESMHKWAKNNGIVLLNAVKWETAGV